MSLDLVYTTKVYNSETWSEVKVTKRFLDPYYFELGIPVLEANPKYVVYFRPHPKWFHKLLRIKPNWVYRYSTSHDPSSYLKEMYSKDYKEDGKE